MTRTPTPDEIETLRKGIRLNATPDERRAACDLVDRLSPAPEPEVDEATVWTRKAFQAIYKLPEGDRGHEGGAPFNRVRAVIADLIASKDGEAEEAHEIGKNDGQDEAVAHIDRLTGGDGEYFASTMLGRGCPDAATMIAGIVSRFKDAESELATLRAENERCVGLLRWAHDTLYEINPSMLFGLTHN